MPWCDGTAFRPRQRRAGHVQLPARRRRVRLAEHIHAGRRSYLYEFAWRTPAVELARGLSSRVRQGGAVFWRCAVLAGAAAWSLVGHDSAVVEDLAAPDAEWFAPVECAGQAFQPGRAVRAQRLRELEVGRGVGEPQVGTVHLTRKREGRASTDGWRRLARMPTRGVDSPRPRLGSTGHERTITRRARHRAGTRRARGRLHTG